MPTIMGMQGYNHKETKQVLKIKSSQPRLSSDKNVALTKAEYAEQLEDVLYGYNLTLSPKWNNVNYKVGPYGIKGTLGDAWDNIDDTFIWKIGPVSRPKSIYMHLFADNRIDLYYQCGFFYRQYNSSSSWQVIIYLSDGHARGNTYSPDGLFVYDPSRRLLINTSAYKLHEIKYTLDCSTLTNWCSRPDTEQYEIAWSHVTTFARETAGDIFLKEWAINFE